MRQKSQNHMILHPQIFYTMEKTVWIIDWKTSLEFLDVPRKLHCTRNFLKSLLLHQNCEVEVKGNVFILSHTPTRWSPFLWAESWPFCARCLFFLIYFLNAPGGIWTYITLKSLCHCTKFPRLWWGLREMFLLLLTESIFIVYAKRFCNNLLWWA